MALVNGMKISYEIKLGNELARLISSHIIHNLRSILTLENNNVSSS